MLAYFFLWEGLDNCQFKVGAPPLPARPLPPPPSVGPNSVDRTGEGVARPRGGGVPSEDHEELQPGPGDRL